MQKLGLASGSLLTMPLLSFTQNQNPQLPLELVKDFVVAGHGNFDKTKSMLLQEPALLYATYDWGNGDFETALEGAGHVGNKEIANYLIGKGARTNLFVLTMLGKTEIVQPFLEIFPSHQLECVGISARCQVIKYIIAAKKKTVARRTA